MWETGKGKGEETMNISQNDTAVVITDPQNDVLSEKGVGWGLAGDNSVSFYGSSGSRVGKSVR